MEKCGYIAEINTEKCDTFICTKCGRVLYEKVNNPIEHYKKLKGKLGKHES